MGLGIVVCSGNVRLRHIQKAPCSVAVRRDNLLKVIEPFKVLVIFPLQGST